MSVLSGARDVEINHHSFDEYEQNFRSSDSEQPETFSPTCWKRARVSVEEDIKQLRDAEKTNTSSLNIVLLDDTFYYKSMRKRFCPHGIIWIKTEIDLCIARNRFRNVSVPGTVIERMGLLLELPEDSPNYPIMTLSPFCDDGPEKICKIATSNTEFWAQAVAASKRESFVHVHEGLTPRDTVLNLLESRLRRCVSYVLSENRFSIPLFRREVSKLKAQTVAEFKRWYDQEKGTKCPSDMLEFICSKFIRQVTNLIVS